MPSYRRSHILCRIAFLAASWRRRRAAAMAMPKIDARACRRHGWRRDIDGTRSGGQHRNCNAYRARNHTDAIASLDEIALFASSAPSRRRSAVSLPGWRNTKLSRIISTPRLAMRRRGPACVSAMCWRMIARRQERHAATASRWRFSEAAHLRATLRCCACLSRRRNRRPRQSTSPMPLLATAALSSSDASLPGGLMFVAVMRHIIEMSGRVTI